MGVKIVAFGGKGGVGKTTCAAAYSLLCAESGKKTLLLTTDPAPNLSDIFEREIGNEEVKIKHNLYAREIDCREELEKLKERVGKVIYLVEDEETGEIFPGIDEVFGLATLLEYKNSDYDVIVWDTAPTGHTLRLLSLPETALRFFGRLTRIYSLLRSFAAKLLPFLQQKEEDSLLGFLEESRGRVEEIKEMLKETSFFVVTRSERLVVRETERLVHSLKEFPIKGIVLNYYPTTKCKCGVCANLRASLKYESDIKRLAEELGVPVVRVPILRDPSNIESLERIADYLKSLEVSE
ncbi:MAG: ArsA family ATPase [Candidatus Desulfofervidus sp.]|nr:ArsA family ATPase [Candidatus Desulfofervidus sp.]